LKQGKTAFGKDYFRELLERARSIRASERLIWQQIEEKLKPEETRRFMDNAFRDGMLKTTGTDIDKIMPPVSRFGGGRAAKKQGIIGKLMIFFEKYFGLI